ncbi:MAG TPA: hypothetical protein VE262_19345 [Blastocatellia bacterium]|nr:hypothetical protein [Blastocatellia bacterium]
MRPVSTWSKSEKVAEALRRSKKYLPASLAQQVDILLSPENLVIVTGTLVIWAGSHFFGVGEIVDVILLLAGSFTIGWAAVDLAKLLLEFATTALNAQTEEDLDRAAKAFADAVLTGGMTVVMAVLLKRSANQLQATRGANVMDVMRPRQPGLGNVKPDPQAGRIWRKPTTTGDPSMAAGTGKTSWFGDMTISTAGTAAEQQLARVHELVHSFLRPRFIVLRTFRARLAGSAYWKSAFLQYLEEAMAETIAQLRVNGLSGLFTGIRFPIQNGYVSIQQLGAEVGNIGRIIVGTHRFTVHFIPAGPSSGNGKADK